MPRRNRRRLGQVLVQHLVLICVLVLPIAALVPIAFRLIQIFFYRISAEVALPIF